MVTANEHSNDKGEALESLLATFASAIRYPWFLCDEAGTLVNCNPEARALLQSEPSALTMVRASVCDEVGSATTMVLQGRSWQMGLTRHTASEGLAYAAVLLTPAAEDAPMVVDRHRLAMEASFDPYLELKAVRNQEGGLEDLEVDLFNQSARQWLGLGSDALGMRLGQFVKCGTGADLRKRYEHVIRTGQPLVEDVALVVKGQAVWIRQRALPLGDGIALTLRDLTELKQAELTTREHNRVLENAMDGIATANPDGAIDFVNSTFASMLGYVPEELIGQPWEVIARPEERAELAAYLSQSIGEGRMEVDLRGHRADGMPLFLNLVLLPRFVQGESYGHYVFAIDVTAQRAYEAQLEHQMKLLNAAHEELAARSRQIEAANERLRDLATSDGLTSLRNHRYLRERLAEEVARANRYGNSLVVFMIDVDSFKAFNDEFGHPAGDEVLRELAGILEAGVRQSDVVARYGGEEFAVVLPHLNLENAKTLAERLRKAVQDYRWSDRPITISIGGAQLGHEIRTSEELVEAADSALYAAKRAGRNCCMFTE